MILGIAFTSTIAGSVIKMIGIYLISFKVFLKTKTDEMYNQHVTTLRLDPRLIFFIIN